MNGDVRPAVRVTAIAATLAGSLALAWVPAPAFAHGIGGDATDRDALGFVSLGIGHMLLGWDHLAFVAGVLLLSGSGRRAVELISLFVLGHSTTLILATTLGWRVDAGLVDAVIASSVAFVGCVGIYGRPRRYGWLGVAVAGYGLVHGLGLATRFQDLGIPPDGRIWKVVAFNIGIEIGQATAIMAFVALAALITSSRAWLRDEDRTARMSQLVCATLFVCGAVAAAMILTDTLSGSTGNDAPRAALATGTSCSIGDRQQDLPTDGDHPPREFYGPEETSPLADFGHSMGDGYVVVLYSPELDPAAVSELERAVTQVEPPAVLAGPDPTLDGDTRVRAMQLRHVMNCGEVEGESIDAFARAWLDVVAP